MSGGVNSSSTASALVAGVAAGSLSEAQAQPNPAPPANLFPENFKSFQVETSGATINGVIGGQGPPVLLMHGYPLSHVSWSLVAPKLAKDYTVVATDLRGYGDSSKPADGINHAGYSKRAMAQDQVEVMKHFGFDKFAAVGHDRGGRVAHRMALDHADKITRAAVLDIIPTSKFYHNITQESATAYYHWFFLIQRAPMPEKCIESNLELFVGRGESPMAKEYLRTFQESGHHPRGLRGLSRRRHASTWSTMSKIRARRSNARCWCCGRSKAQWAAFSTCSLPGKNGLPMCAGRCCPAAIICRMARRTRS